MPVVVQHVSQGTCCVAQSTNTVKQRVQARGRILKLNIGSDFQESNTKVTQHNAQCGAVALLLLCGTHIMDMSQSHCHILESQFHA
jgi:hypothetical protein